MIGIILAGLFGAIMGTLYYSNHSFFQISIIGTLISFLGKVFVNFFIGVLATIGIVVLWIFLKRARRDGRELRVFRKNKEIENRMKRQAMHK